MDTLSKEQDKLDLEQENTHGDYKKMIVVSKKRFNCRSGI